MVGHIEKCQVCSGTELVTILDYGHQRPVHGHLTRSQLNEEEVFYPLKLCFCKSCGQAQIDYVVDPKVVFRPEYPYLTGLTNMLVKNFRQLAEMSVERFKLNKNDLVVDIGSNDGTLLKGFKDKGMRVLGIEPTNIAKIANRNDITTWQEYFTADTVKKIIEKYGHAKIVTAANVYAHIPDPVLLTENIKNLLSPDGVFISESQYFYDTIEKMQLDEVYDEHLRYNAVKPMMRLISAGGMSVVDAERIAAAGGSIRVFAKVGKHTPSERVNEIIRSEEKFGLYEYEKLNKFGENAVKIKHDLMRLVLECKAKGRVVGIGAPGRSNTLLGFARIDNTLLDYAVEKKGSPKIGLYTPHTHIPIYDEELLMKDQPEFGLLLSWHIGDELMKKLRASGYKGKFIMPLPEPHLVDDI
jgi:2-polyprenyl-3-methyl-5-hydroxy-6-metoxy-1,4-benzoquinol methylase